MLSTIALTTLTLLSQSSTGGVQAFHVAAQHSRRSILTSSSSHQKSKSVINTNGQTSRIEHQHRYIHSTLFMKNEDAKSSNSPVRAPRVRNKRAFEQEMNMNTRQRQSSSSFKIDYRLASSISSESYAVEKSQEQEQENNNGLFSSFFQTQTQSQSTDTKDELFPIISAALLITSNTVGASMMVLPGLAQGPGMIASSGLFGGQLVSCLQLLLYCFDYISRRLRSTLSHFQFVSTILIHLLTRCYYHISQHRSTAIYLVNLVSGLLIAEVAINQYESSPASCDVPSSFKEFADANLQSEFAGNAISAISLFINTCVLSYDLVTAGRLTNDAITNDAIKPIFGPDVMNLISSSDNTGLLLAAAFFITLVSTQSGAALSGIASICCMTLFVCFAGLVVPGLANIHDPLATFAAQGTSAFGSEMFMHDISRFIPVLLTAMIYQNIVPTITKMLKYDRDQTFKAIMFGSAIPMFMYIAFCFTVLGGGAMPGAGSGNMFLTGITASSVFGSAMACVISLSEELDVYFDQWKASECDLPENVDANTNTNVEETASLPSVVFGITLPVLAGIFCANGDGFVKALSVSGTYGSPLLYGVVPVALAFTQRTAIMNEIQKSSGMIDNVKATFDKIMNDESDVEKHIVPGGMLPLGALAAGSAALMFTHLIGDLSSLTAVSTSAL